MSDKVNANSLKKDMVIVLNNTLFKVVKQPDHVKPGKGPAYVQLELKSLMNGIKKNERYSSSDVFDKAFIENKKVKYLYDEDDSIVVMDNEFEQFFINKVMLDKIVLKLLEDNMDLEVQMHEGKVIDVKLPLTIEKEIESAEPNIKNSTAAGSLKKATLVGGVDIKVPTYVDMGDKIILNTEDMAFVKMSKAKN